MRSEDHQVRPGGCGNEHVAHLGIVLETTVLDARLMDR
jgi:hypothetical protein